MTVTTVLFWRRLDLHGLERLTLSVGADGITAEGRVLGLEAGGFELSHRWRLGPDWRTVSVEVDRWDARGHRRLRLERAGTGWRVDGTSRPDLEGAEEPDLSVTPFCNTLAIRRTSPAPGDSLTLDIAFIDGATLEVVRSRQRYVRQAARSLRYVDLGVASGFEADIHVDAQGLVERYEGLFERVGAADPGLKRPPECGGPPPTPP